MGMTDTVIILDEGLNLSCPAGHVVRCFRTKDFEQPSMDTYLVRAGRLFLAVSDERSASHDEAVGWDLRGDSAIREHRFSLREIQPTRVLSVYGYCSECDPVLVRCDHATFLGDFVKEYALFVDFNLTFRAGGSVGIERRSGTRADLREDLRSRGVYVLEDDEPLAVAHRELERACSRSRHMEWACS
jgi:hypothetical protein